MKIEEVRKNYWSSLGHHKPEKANKQKINVFNGEN